MSRRKSVSRPQSMIPPRPRSVMPPRPVSALSSGVASSVEQPVDIDYNEEEFELESGLCGSDPITSRVSRSSNHMLEKKVGQSHPKVGPIFVSWPFGILHGKIKVIPNAMPIGMF